MRMVISVGGERVAVAELESRNPVTAKVIWDGLPVRSTASLWGDEVYFTAPFKLPDENPGPSSKPGDISYWSPGPALCIFFGKTQPYSPVNHIGRIVEGLESFRGVREGDIIELHRI